MLSKLPPRERQIVDILYERGPVAVADICDALGFLNSHKVFGELRGSRWASIRSSGRAPASVATSMVTATATRRWRSSGSSIAVALTNRSVDTMALPRSSSTSMPFLIDGTYRNDSPSVRA